MEFTFKYGKSEKRIVFPEKADVSVLGPLSAPTVQKVVEAFEGAMGSPLRCPKLEEMGAPPRSVAIAVSDETRPVPITTLLPPLLERIYRAFPHLGPENVTIVIGGGLHPPPGRDQIRKLVPESIAPACNVVAHDALHSPMSDYGTTSRKTPVIINSHFAQADLKCVIGNIDPHQFVGFTGGAKGGVIGCGAKATIEANHALMFDDKARVGNIEGNPVRLDIDEAGALIGVRLVVDVVLDGSKQIVELLIGDPIAVYREGAKTCAQVYGVHIPEKFDMVVASCGGYPKDINLYQAQKGLAHAAQAVKPGGKILLLAQCPEGHGHTVYFDYVSQFSSPDAVLEDFRRSGFRMGAHKAFLFARTLVGFDVAIGSDMPTGTLKQCLLNPVDPQEAVEQWIVGFQGKPTVGVIPNANTSYFYTS